MKIKQQNLIFRSSDKNNAKNIGNIAEIFKIVKDHHKKVVLNLCALSAEENTSVRPLATPKKRERIL